MWRSISIGLLVGASLLPIVGQAEDNGLVVHRTLGLGLAANLAQAALESCQEADFQVAVAVVDRFGVLQVLLRDRYAGPVYARHRKAQGLDGRQLSHRYPKPGDTDVA